MDQGALSTFLGAWGYPALLALLVLTGVGSPIPEDLLLLSAGYLVFVGVFEWSLALGFSAVGVVTSDLMLYSAGRHIGWRSERWPGGHFLSPERLQGATRWFARCGQILVLVARLVPGTRAIVFVTAGVHSVPVWAFLRYDILGAALWVPAMLASGYFGGSRIGDLGNVVDWLERAGSFVFVIACLALLTWFWLGREQSKL